MSIPGRSMVVLMLVGLACARLASAQTPDDRIRLPVREGYVSVADSVRLFYRMIGEGSDTVVVIHGGPGFHSNYLAPDLTPLAARHTLIFFDQRNAGRSTLLRDTAQVNARHLVTDMEALRIHFGMERMTLLGHSWGGLLAGMYAEQYPERIRRMILVGAVAPTAEAMRPFNPMSRLDSTANADRMRNLTLYRAAPSDRRRRVGIITHCGRAVISRRRCRPAACGVTCAMYRSPQC